MAGDPMGLQGAYGAAGASDALQRLRAQVIQRQQLALKNAMDEREMRLRESQAQHQNTYQNEALASLKEERTANTALRHQNAAHLVTQDYQPGDVLPSEASGTLKAGNLGGLMEHQPQTMTSTQTGGAVTMPQLRGRMIQPSGAVSPERGAAAEGALTSTTSPGHAEQDIYKGTAGQRRVAQQDTMLRGMLRMMPPESPEAKALAYQMATNHPIPAGVLKDPNQSFDDFKRKHDYSVAHPTSQPTVVIQTPTGPQIVNKNTRTAMPITDQSGGAVPLAPTAQERTHATATKEAINTLDQLDQSIDAAKDLVGPGAGRVSSLEQMIGNADPRVQALGTKMLLAKMKVDAGIGGMRAAASPQLLARWDNLLSNHVTPEGLKAAVQAMREILGGASAGSGAPTKPSAAELIKKYGG